MPHFSTNKRSCRASDRNHARLIQLQSTINGEVSRPAAATIQIMKIAWVTYLGALSRLNAILIPRISAHPPILAQCKVHRSWALFREGTVYARSERAKLLVSIIGMPIPRKDPSHLITMEALAGHKTWSISYLVSSLAASLTRVPKRG